MKTLKQEESLKRGEYSDCEFSFVSNKSKQVCISLLHPPHFMDFGDFSIPEWTDFTPTTSQTSSPLDTSPKNTSTPPKSLRQKQLPRKSSLIITKSSRIKRPRGGSKESYKSLSERSSPVTVISSTPSPFRSVNASPRTSPPPESSDTIKDDADDNSEATKTHFKSIERILHDIYQQSVKKNSTKKQLRDEKIQKLGGLARKQNKMPRKMLRGIREKQIQQQVKESQQQFLALGTKPKTANQIRQSQKKSLSQGGNSGLSFGKYDKKSGILKIKYSDIS